MRRRGLAGKTVGQVKVSNQFSELISIFFGILTF